MKNNYSLKKDIRISISAIIFSLALSLQVLGQDPVNHKDISIFVSCVEPLENGNYLAHFGYDNPNDYIVNVAKKNSYIQLGSHPKKHFVLSEFQIGVHDKILSYEFNSSDQVTWTVITNTYSEKHTTATNSSEPCFIPQLPIIPGYQPPDGGKQLFSKIGSELTSLANYYNLDPAGFSEVTDQVRQLRGSGLNTEVLIEVNAESSQYTDMMYSLNLMGFDQLSTDETIGRATGWISVEDLLSLNALESLRIAGPVFPGVSNYIVPATGLVNSQGDFAMHSDFVRLGYDVDGSGVKIGVLSNSYDTKGQASTDVINGDLPGIGNPNYPTPVEVLQDAAPSFGILSDEGRAMLQIVHDIAPGAQLGFRTGYLGEQDMADGIDELAAAGYDVLVDDISYLSEPLFQGWGNLKCNRSCSGRWSHLFLLGR